MIDVVDDDGQPLHLATHLSRAGWLKWLDAPSLRPVKMGRGPLAARLTFVSTEGEICGGFDLTEAGTQKRLAIYLVRDLADVPGIARLGPDPTDASFTRDAFDQVLATAGKRHLKTLLRDQSVLAGVGQRLLRRDPAHRPAESGGRSRLAGLRRAGCAVRRPFSRYWRPPSSPPANCPRRN